MKYWMDKAAWHKPSVLVLDNIDKLMGTELEVRLACRFVPPKTESLTARGLVPHAARNRAVPSPVRLFRTLGGAQRERRRPPRRGRISGIPPPPPQLVAPVPGSGEPEAAIEGCAERGAILPHNQLRQSNQTTAVQQILAHLVKDHMDSSDLTHDPTAPLNYTALATQTEGYSVTDLKDLVARGVHRAAIRSSEAQLELGGLDEAQPVCLPQRLDAVMTREAHTPLQTTLTPADFASAQVDFVPHSLRDVKLQKSDIAWADIGGASSVFLFSWRRPGLRRLTASVRTRGRSARNEACAAGDARVANQVRAYFCAIAVEAAVGVRTRSLLYSTARS